MALLFIALLLRILMAWKFVEHSMQLASQKLGLSRANWTNQSIQILQDLIMEFCASVLKEAFIEEKTTWCEGEASLSVTLAELDKMARSDLKSEVKKTESMSDNLVANTMSEAAREVKKPEIMEFYAWIRTADGSIQEVEREVAMLCPTIDHEMKSGLGSSKNNPILLPPGVQPTSLSLVFDYCRFHRVSRSEQEHKTFDENFLQMDARSLSELLDLSNYLQLRPLFDCTSEAMAQKINNKSTEEIWDMMDLPDDLPEAEKLEVREYSTYDSRMRLLEKMYTNKRKTLVKKIEDLKDFVTGVKARQHEETRNIDDLVSFINGGDGDTKGVQTSKKKKKNRRKGKDQKKTSSSSASSSSKKVIENHDKDINASDSANRSGSTADTLKLLGTRDESFNVEKYAGDDDLDPVLKEKIDREVEKFARMLNVDLNLLYHESRLDPDTDGIESDKD